MSIERREEGLALRKKVLGTKHVSNWQQSGDTYTMQQNDLVNEFAWGTIWSRPGLSLKERSLITLAMLAALDRQDELRGHILGALNNGATKDEIIEVFVHSAVYCGFPTSNTCVRLCAMVFKDEGLV